MYFWLCRNFSWHTISEIVSVEPLFCTLLSLWAKCGQSDLWVRLPSVMAGVMTTAAAYFVGKQLVGPRTAWYNGLLFSSAPVLVFYERDGKMYAWLALLTLLTLHFAIRLGEQGQPRGLLAYTASTLATVYIHRLAPL